MTLICWYIIVGIYYNAFLLSSITKLFQGNILAFNYIFSFSLNLSIFFIITRIYVYLNVLFIIWHFVWVYIFWVMQNLMISVMVCFDLRYTHAGYIHTSITPQSTFTYSFIIGCLTIRSSYTDLVVLQSLVLLPLAISISTILSAGTIWFC